MAVARPIRMLGASCIILILFLVFQINKGPTYVSKGSNKEYTGIQSDPLKERTWPSFLAYITHKLVCISG
jgi:mannosyltransferase